MDNSIGACDWMGSIDWFGIGFKICRSIGNGISLRVGSYATGVGSIDINDINIGIWGMARRLRLRDARVVDRQFGSKCAALTRWL